MTFNAIVVKLLGRVIANVGMASKDFNSAVPDRLTQRHRQTVDDRVLIR